METFKYNPSVLPAVTLTSDVGGLVSFDDVVRVQETNGQKYAVLNLTEKLDEIQTSISALPTTAAINSAVSNALSVGRYVQAPTLKSITVNGIEQSLLKSGSDADTTINITTGGGSGSGSTVSYNSTAKLLSTSGSLLGTLTIDGSSTEIRIRDAQRPTAYDNGEGLMSGAYVEALLGLNNMAVNNWTIKQSIAAYSNSIRHYLIYYVYQIMCSANTNGDYGRIARLSITIPSGDRLEIWVSKVSNHACTVEGQLTLNDAGRLWYDTNACYRKYFVTLDPSITYTTMYTNSSTAFSSVANATETYKLICSSDMFEYTSDTNTLSITTE